MARLLATGATLGVLSCGLPLVDPANGSIPNWWLRDAECIAYYESSNQVHDAANPDYRGLYQIGYAEWASVGGSGDPAAASWWQQTWRAWLLWLRRGWEPWQTAPLCGL